MLLLHVVMLKLKEFSVEISWINNRDEAENRFWKLEHTAAEVRSSSNELCDTIKLGGEKPVTEKHFQWI